MVKVVHFMLCLFYHNFKKSYFLIGSTMSICHVGEWGRQTEEGQTLPVVATVEKQAKGVTGAMGAQRRVCEVKGGLTNKCRFELSHQGWVRFP